MKKQQSKTFYDKPWKHIIVAIVAFMLSYATASWAIDSGRLMAYFATIVLIFFGIKHLVQAIPKGNAK